MIKRYFADDGEDVLFFDTENEAMQCAEKGIEAWREYGGSEWPEEVERVCWGVVMEQATGNELTGGRIEYKLAKVT